jgi:hypothetical protein
MKIGTFILLLLLGIGGWYLYKSPLGPRIIAAFQGSFNIPLDAKVQLKEMEKSLPHMVRLGEPVKEVATYLKRTDDPLFPITGYLTFAGASRYEYVFYWDTDHWVFSRMVSRENEHDITEEQIGIDIMNGPEMTRFLFPYKNPRAARLVLDAPARPTGYGAAPVIPPRTPTPQEKALDIAHKYGRPK